MSNIKIGWATQDITPIGPASLFGQYYERISTYVESPLTATAMAIESAGGNGEKEQAIMVSMDLLCSTQSLQDELKQLLYSQLPDFDTDKLFLNATHTHSAPNPAEPEYRKLLLDRLGKVVVEAWSKRLEAGISEALGYAVVAHNRRVQYADGKTEMYGSTQREDFIGLEGPTDSAVNMLFCWNKQKELTGVIVNVPCPAQVTEAKYYVSADYWSEVRKQLKLAFGKEIFILAQCGAAGDLAPRDLPRQDKPDQVNMWEQEGCVEIAARLVPCITQGYSEAKNNIQYQVEFKHTVKRITIPTRQVSEAEYKEALAVSAEIHAKEPGDVNSPDTAWNRFVQEVKANEKTLKYGPWDNKNSDYGIVRKKDAVIEQYLNRDNNMVYNMELHVLRLGNIALASNSFELFLDFGLHIIGRSSAKQTFIVQLSCDYCDYLATERALQGGGYSAMANPVGADGGWTLVKKTVAAINQLWD